MLAKLASGSLLDAAGTSTLMHLLETTAFNDRINYYLGGFTIVQAESQEAAAKLFVNHPHFAIFPGDGVEVMEILPVPQEHG